MIAVVVVGLYLKCFSLKMKRSNHYSVVGLVVEIVVEIVAEIVAEIVVELVVELVDIVESFFIVGN